MVMLTTEKRALRLAPGVVMQMISGQAGSLAKAVTEAVMNSVDAYATQVNIQLRSDFLCIEDDGKGFQNREEIEAWFEVLGGSAGLKGHRIYGEFGLGRAQLWKYCPTTWHSGEFSMEVNVPKSGFNYVLAAAPKRVGTLIEGGLFAELAPLQLQETLREIKALCALVTTPVFLNGEQISTPPGSLKWSHESELAFGELSKAKRGDQLAVYNQGVFVCWVPPSPNGLAGKICTKEGQALKLNIARNQLMGSCPVWKAISDEWLAKADSGKGETLGPAELAKKGARELANLARGTLDVKKYPGAGYRRYEPLDSRGVELLDALMARDVLGNNHTLRQVLECPLPQLFTSLPAGGMDAARALQARGLAIVYTTDTYLALTGSSLGPAETLALVVESSPVKEFLAANGMKPDFRFKTLDEEFPSAKEMIKPIDNPGAALRAALEAFGKALVALAPEFPVDLREAWAALELQPVRMLQLAKAEGAAIQVSDKALLSGFTDVDELPALLAVVVKEWLDNVAGMPAEQAQAILGRVRVTERFFQVPVLALLLRSEMVNPDLPALSTGPLRYLRNYVAA